MLSFTHLPDLDKLAAGADCDHVAVIGHPDLVHILIVIFVTPSVTSGANLRQNMDIQKEQRTAVFRVL